MEEKENSKEEEFAKINGLLHDTAFALEMAMGQDAAYFLNQGQKAPPFFQGPDSLINKPFKEEKIAINLAGFYAVECGIGVLIDQKGKTPVFWLQQIIDRTLDSNDVLLLNRFANATWKTGQAFRGLVRIKRDNFVGANFLSKSEIQKDADQIFSAAAFLFDTLKSFSNDSKETQVEMISKLLKDKQFAFKMAKHMEAAYFNGQNKSVPLFLSPAEDTAIIQKSAREEKIAINTTGFYALECGVNYLATSRHKLPSEILRSIVDDSINQKDKWLLERFANAAWKAAQPFRSLDRISRDNFIPFELLSKEEVKKDWDQIKSAAERVLKLL